MATFFLTFRFRCASFFPPSFFVRCASIFLRCRFFGDVERAHLVSSVLHGLFVSFSSCFAGLLADAQLGSRSCFALAA